MAEPLLKVNDLTVNYGGTAPAVDGISFAVDGGATLGIVGESGAGKSTLALALAALLGPSGAAVSGEIFFAGRNLLALGEDELIRVRGAGIGMIFQDPVGSLDPSMPVINQVAESFMIHQQMDKGAATRNAAALLADLGVEQEMLSVAPYAHQLSGGLCQRALIAATIACKPKVLIADEPTSSLDTTTQAQIVDLLKQKQSAGGIAMVFISHDLPLVSKIADEILVIQRGRAVESGGTADVISRPRHPYTVELIAAWEKAGAGGKRVGVA